VTSYIRRSYDEKMRDTFFVSYSHIDRQIMGELQERLSSIFETAQIMIWDDTRISPSTRWRNEIEEALSTSAAAVLLLSPSFFASNFIALHELPILLRAADRGEIKIFPVILAPCDHERVTAIYQAVHDTAHPLDTLHEPERRKVWERLTAGLRVVAAQIGDETHIAAEMKRLENDVAMAAAVYGVNEKISRAKIDPAFDENEAMRENTLVFLEGQRCQAVSTWLVEQSKRDDLPPFRGKAIVRMMKEIAEIEEQALKRATELTRQFANDTVAMLNQAKGQQT
jgi:hypothetical protein